MRVLLASKALVVGAHHDKLRALGANADIEILAAAPECWIENGRVRKAERPEPDAYDIEYLRLGLNGHYHMYWFRSLERLMRRFRPDVVHIDEEPYNLATAIACRDSLRHGARPVFFSWQNLFRRYPPPVRWIERYVLDRAHGIAGTQTAAQVLRRKGYRRRIAVIPQFGVDPTVFVPDKHSRANLRFTIGYAGRLVSEKGVDVLIQAVHLAGGKAVLRVAGTGPAESRLRRMTANSVEVNFLGSVASEEMPSFYRGLDVFVLPTVGRRGWTEQFGRAAVEAMACGIPTVVAKTGELPSVVGSSGELVQPGNAHELAEVLRRLRCDPIQRTFLAKAGRNRALELFTTAAIADATASFYRTIVSG